MSRNPDAYKPKKGQRKVYEDIKSKHLSDNVTRWAAHLVGVLKKSDMKKLLKILNEYYGENDEGK